MEAAGRASESVDDFALVDELSRLSGVEVPKAVEEIREAEVLHHTVVDPAQMKETVKKFLLQTGE